MGCENSKIVTEDRGQEEESTRPISQHPKKINPEIPMQLLKPPEEQKVYPPGQAFVITLNGKEEPKISDYKDECAGTATPALVKKPPKRLQELIYKANTTDHSLKLQDLEEKMNRAEQGRQEFIKQKITSSSPKKNA